MKVCILGAGPCGLTAAWELSKKSVEVTVIEKDDSVGGLCKTGRKDGYQFDLGGHRFISSDSRLVEEIRALMGGSLQSRKRKSVIRFSDRQYDYPLNLRSVITGSSPWQNLRFAAGYLAAASGLANPRSVPGTFDYWTEKKFGRPIADFFFGPYTEKLWGVNADKLSSDWAAQRIPQLNAKNALLSALGLTGKKVRSFASTYLYPERGIGAIFEQMAHAIKRGGGEIATGASVAGFEKKGGVVTGVVVRRGAGEKQLLKADLFLSTIPIDELQNLLGEGGDRLPYRSLRFLNVMLDIENLSPNTWMYVPEPDLIMTRIQEPKRRSDLSAPKGKTSVMLEIPCDYGDTIWRMPEEEFLEIGLRDMKKLGFDLSRHVSGFFTTRARFAYPRFDIGYREKVDRIRRNLTKYKNLTTLGRQGLFRYIFMDTAMLMGRKWADSITGTGDPAGPAGIAEMQNEPTLIETESVAS